MSFTRRHALLLILIALWLVVVSFGMYGDWLVYQSDQEAHHEAARFGEFLVSEFGGIQWAMNFQSELLGFIVVVIFKDAIKKWLGSGSPPPDEEQA